MKDIDAMMDDALEAEERALLSSIEEPGFFGEAAGIFQGKTGWVNGVMMAAQGVLFLGGAWAAWRFFEAGDPVTQLRWGLPAAVLLVLATIIKMALVPRMETNRVIRELKRIELQLAYAARR